MFRFFKKNLIIVIIDDKNNKVNFKNSLFYDLCVINTSSIKIKTKSKFYFEIQSDQKFKLVYKILNFIDIKKYKTIWVPDADIHISNKDLICFLEIFSNYGFDLAQPSIFSNGNAEFDFLETRNDLLFRTVNFIDMRAPIFRLDSFLKLKDYFKDDNFCFDWIFPKMLGYKKVAIIDAAQVIYKNKIENYIEENIDLDKFKKTLTDHQIQPFFVQFSKQLKEKEKILKDCSFKIKNNFKFKRPSRKDNGCGGRLGFSLSNRMMKFP